MEMLDIIKAMVIVGFFWVMAIFMPNSLSASNLESENSCMEYKLSVDEKVVDEKSQVQVTLEYQTKTPTCNFQRISGSSYTVDLSELVLKGNDITVQADKNIFDVNIKTDGHVVLKYKNLVHPDETLTDLGGKVIFNVNVKKVKGDENASISDSSGQQIKIKIQDGDDENLTNTNKVSSTDYVKVGSVIDYTVAINEKNQNVNNFLGIDTADSSLEYVPNSFWAEEDKTWKDASDLFKFEVDENNHLQVENKSKLTKPYLLHYQMQVTGKAKIYNSEFTAKYDQKSETVKDDVRYNFKGGGWSDYEHVKIKVHAVDNQNHPLENVQLEIRDPENNVVGTLKTNEQGIATSKNLAYGKYTVTETKVPKGYKIDDQLLQVNLKNPNQVANINIKSINKTMNMTSNESIENANDKLVKENMDTKNNLSSSTKNVVIKFIAIIVIVITAIITIIKLL